MAEEKDDPRSQGRQPGVGVDAMGGQVIDPTKNVEDLFRAGEFTNEKLRAADNRFLDSQISWGEKFQNFAREAQDRFQNLARESESRLHLALLNAETRRIDQIASTTQVFQNTIRDMLAESVKSTSSLVSTQLVQIQATFDTRVTKLEAYQLTQAGRSSVADPAIDSAMSRLANSLTLLRDNQDDALSRLKTGQDEALAKMAAAVASVQFAESGSSGRAMGRVDTNARLLSVVMAVAAVASPVIAILVTIMAMRGH